MFVMRAVSHAVSTRPQGKGITLASDVTLGLSTGRLDTDTERTDRTNDDGINP